MSVLNIRLALSTHARSLRLLLVLAGIAGCAEAPLVTEDEPSAPQAVAVSSSAVVAKGKICVAPIGDARVSCVASGGDVATAYRGAQATCSSCYYDMWPEFPAGMTIDQGARNQEAVTQLQSDVDRILSFAATQKAEAYAATLGGKLSQVLQSVQRAQQNAIGQADPRVTGPLERFDAKLRALAAAETDPVVAELASLRKTTDEIRAILTDAETRFAASRQAYNALVTRFKTYKGTEAQLTTDLRGFSTRASAATLADIPRVQTDLINYVSASTRVPNDLIIDATRLGATMAQIEAQVRARLDPYFPFIQTHIGDLPEFSLVAQRSLANMAAYCEQRRLQTDRVVSDLLGGIAARRDVLIAAAADAKTRTTFKQNAHLKASSAFLDEATARNNEISKAAPKTTKYGFSLWAEKYDQYLAVLELEPLCGPQNNPARPSWRDTGCISFRRSFSRARTYTTSTIPQLIRLAIPQLRSKGVAESMLAEIQTALTQKRVRDAAFQYDTAARLTENM